MHILDHLGQHRPTISFEFFPPKNTKGLETLESHIQALLEAHSPPFVSVTYGAGGSTRELTHDLVLKLKEQRGLDPIPHLTCVCHTEAEIDDILTQYAQAGISNLLALGGDPPQNLEGYRKENDHFQHAADLVRHIKAFQGHPDPRGFGIGVAGFPEGHPATPNRLLEMDYLKAKVDQGADYICTQLFFDNHDFYDFRERCELAGITIPILAGIMPISTISGMKRMAELAAGARFPAKLLRHLAGSEGDDQKTAELGIDYAISQCQDLISQGVDGLHLYTLNKSDATLRILKALQP